MNKLRSILTLVIFVTLTGCNVEINSETTIIETTTTISPETTTTTTTQEITTTTELTTTTEEITLDNTYYSNAIGKTGDELKSALHEIIDNHTIISYSDAEDALRYTDEDPNNPSNIILFYTGRSQGKFTDGCCGDDWNREHIWPKSLGDLGKYGPGSDIHHLRPTDASVNGARGNLNFDYGGSTYSECTILICKKDGDSWEPDDSIKGDVARMIFYMAVRYEGDDGFADLEINDSSNNGSQSGSIAYIGKLSILLEWNRLDPVSEFEMNRNNIIYDKYQHNRNPFIDHPEWADLIWINV